MTRKDKLKIMQWNIRSIKANRDNLINLISERDPDLIFLNETWLKPTQTFNLKAYKTLRQDRDDGYGGVATCIKTNIKFDKIRDINSDSTQCIIIKISDYHLINVYTQIIILMRNGYRNLCGTYIQIKLL